MDKSFVGNGFNVIAINKCFNFSDSLRNFYYLKPSTLIELKVDCLKEKIQNQILLRLIYER